MTIIEMIRKVDDFLDNRNLKTPQRRKNAIRHIAEFMKSTGKFMSNGNLMLPSDKDTFKESYQKHKGKSLSRAEVSAINHMYDIVHCNAMQNTIAPIKKTAMSKAEELMANSSIISNNKKVVTTNIEPVGSNNSKIGLKPWVGENPKVLILGSLPGDESLKQQAYYCNKGNFFWRIMHNLFGESEADNRTFITSQGIALWDCICSAERSGSSDARIKSGTEVYNNIEEFLAQYPTIKTIVFNGQKAEKSFRKQRKNIDCATIRLVSTSGAAAKSLKERLDNWSIIRELVK